jgi:hypothetical protein
LELPASHDLESENDMNQQVIEWAPFRLKPGIDEAALIEASERLQSAFLERQDGFIRRELVRRGEGDYVDVVWWQTMAAAQKAMQLVADSPTCGSYFAVMASNDAGAGDGVEHFHSVRRYPGG